MLTRRSVTALVPAMIVAAGVGPLARHARAQPSGQAASFVESTAGQLVAVVNSPNSPEEKRRQLQGVIDATVDVHDIAHFCLGRFWRTATAEQKQQYLILFGDLLVTQIAGHLGEYRGVRVTVETSRVAEDTDIVVTTVERPGNPTYQVDWVVSTATGSPKIIDLLAGGTSLRATQSSDFAAYLTSHQYNIPQLLDAMRILVAQGN